MSNPKSEFCEVNGQLIHSSDIKTGETINLNGMSLTKDVNKLPSLKGDSNTTVTHVVINGNFSEVNVGYGNIDFSKM